MKTANLFFILVTTGLCLSAQAETRRSSDSLAVESASGSPGTGAAAAAEVNTARDAGSGMATGKRATAQDHNSSRSNKTASVHDDLDSDNDGVGDESQGMAIKEQGIPAHKSATTEKTKPAKGNYDLKTSHVK